MTNYTLSLIFSFSISLAAIIGLLRFKRMVFTYRPFIFIVWLAFLNELVSPLMIQLIGTNSVNNNIYVLIESLLFVWLFNNWGALQRRKLYLPVLCVVLIIAWIYDSFILNKITDMSPVYRIFSSFVLIFLSIDQINRLIVQETGNILFSSKFLICIGVIIFYTYKATMDVFFLKLSMSLNFERHIFLIREYVNLLVNLIYALAVLWIPTKQKFTLPS